MCVSTLVALKLNISSEIWWFSGYWHTPLFQINLLSWENYIRIQKQNAMPVWVIWVFWVVLCSCFNECMAFCGKKELIQVALYLVYLSYSCTETTINWEKKTFENLDWGNSGVAVAPWFFLYTNMYNLFRNNLIEVNWIYYG